MYTDQNTLVGTCGVGLLYNFREQNNAWNDYRKISSRPTGGAGFDVAGFVSTPECQRAYEELCKKRKLIFQSPVRVNKNSNNDFFFCIFDKKRGAKTVAVVTNWPFKDWLGEKK